MITYLCIDAYKSNKIKLGMNEMRVNDSEMSMRWNNEAWSMVNGQWSSSRESATYR